MAKGSTRASLLGLLNLAQSSTSRRNSMTKISLLSLARSSTSKRSLMIRASLLSLNWSLMSRRDLTVRASLLSPFSSSSQSSKSILVVNNRE